MKLLAAALCATRFFGAPVDKTLVVPPEELAPILHPYLQKKGSLDIHLRDGTMLRWDRGGYMESGALKGFEAGESVPIDSISLLRISYRSPAKMRRVLSGVGGFLIGSLIGSTLALGISDSHGNDGLAIVVLVGMPITGAWVGQHLGRGGLSHVTLIVRRSANSRTQEENGPMSGRGDPGGLQNVTH